MRLYDPLGNLRIVNISKSNFALSLSLSLSHTHTHKDNLQLGKTDIICKLRLCVF